MLPHTHSAHPAHFNEVLAETSEHLGPLGNNLLLIPPLGDWQAPPPKSQNSKAVD